jgi:predicted negative regulator of RcsB-dependent stress response|tara:strand:- start:34876 stop:35553 length:678 start_codon:yes stop_codon:yes gene_type:complete
VETFRTEEEQVEAIKRWWQENGKSTVFGIALALAIVFGWKGWQGHVKDQGAEASAIFDNLMIADAAVQRDGTSRNTAEHLANTLKDQYGNLSYGQFAALYKAKYAVQDGEYDAAASELEWVLDQGPEPVLMAQTQLRLAQVRFALDDYAAALALLEDVASSGYAAQAAELRGDILFAQGDKPGALSAYQQAKVLAREQEVPSNNALLDLKISDLSVAATTEKGTN